MNTRQLVKLGVPAACVKSAITAIQLGVAAGAISSKEVKDLVGQVLASPQEFVEHTYLGPFARDLIEDRSPVNREPVEYRTWGADGIDEQSHAQMQVACRLPCAQRAALMADAHVGYGLPIGGVLACRERGDPVRRRRRYCVSYEAFCLGHAIETLDGRFEQYRDALERGTRFGVGAKYDKPQNHSVMDQDWTITRVTRENKDKAWRQLGTSGSGNHFAEFGILSLDHAAHELGLVAGQYVALLSHSGSRGTGRRRSARRTAR